MRWLIVIGVLTLFLVPAMPAQEAGEDDDYTHLYGHIFAFRRNNPMPMNTVFPEGEEDYSIGFDTPMVYYGPVSDELPCVVGLQDEWINCEPKYEIESNEEWFYSYNAGVPFIGWEEYGAGGGMNALDADLELQKNIHFDPTKPIQAQFYMAADATGWRVLPNLGDGDIPWPYPSWNLDYGVVPNWVLFSKAYAAPPEYTSEKGANYTRTQMPQIILDEENGGSIQTLGVGETEPFTMFSLPTTVGYQVIYRFDIDLGAPQTESAPAGSTLWWWVDWYSDMGDDLVLAPSQLGWAVDSGEFFPPHLSLPMTNPMDIEMVMPQFTDDNKLVIIALFNSPFGAYDVPLDSASFEIIGPDGSVIATEDDDTITWMQKAAREQQSLLGVSPEAAIARGQATWLWNYLAEKDIKPGDYTVRVRAENMQGKAAFKEAYFTIEEGLGKGAVTSSLGGMFTFSKEDIKKLEECHGCHDAATGDLLEGVQNVTMAEAKAMQEAGELGTPDTDDAEAEKKSPMFPVVVLLGALVALARRRR